MTPLPRPSADGRYVVWRIDRAIHAAAWDSGEGARLVGGRWSSKGRPAVYCSVDPATAILEVAVHRGFEVLDTSPHVLSEIRIDAAGIVLVARDDVPNPAWLHPGALSAGQQAFGDGLLNARGMFMAPSVVSNRSWNLIFDPEVAAGRYALKAQERLAIDPRLNPPK
jgi:RES domain-containing protein